MDENGAAPMGGQSDAPMSMTVEELVEAVSGSVSDSLGERLDELESRLEAVAGRAQVDGLSERLDALSGVAATREDLRAASARMEEAALQAGELVPVGEEVGPVMIELVGRLLDTLDSDGDGASDVAAAVSEIRTEVRDISGALVHPAMTTDFADYTVLEAVLLLLVVWGLIKFWLSEIGGAFAWLR